MLTPDESTTALDLLFERERVVDIAVLFKTLGTDSRMSVFRRLSPLGYLSSYNHGGRYYTLRRIPLFDENGLWQYQGALFSSHGSLKETTWRLVDRSEAGWTHEELRDRLRVRVHNTLLELLREKRVRREEHMPHGGARPLAVFLYLSGDVVRAGIQRERREQRGADRVDPGVEPFLAVEILVEVVHGSRVVPAAAVVASRLASRGIAVTPQAVEAVYHRHGLGKKTTTSASMRSRR